MNGAVTRRRFLGLSGAGLLALGIGQLLLEDQVDVTAGLFSDAVIEPDPNRRVLVVVDLDGGNDPLNTLIPSAGRYFDLRPKLAVSEDRQLRWNGLTHGTNPALAPLEPLWDAGLLSAIWGIGLPGQTRSHFVAQDAWRSAQPGRPLETGWLGRWLAADPSPQPLRAVSIGTSLQATGNVLLRPAERHTALRTVADQRLVPPFGSQAALAAFAMLGSGDRADLARSQIRDSVLPAVAAADELRLVLDGATGRPATSIGAMFDVAAQLIERDVGTRIIYITVTGFDTHAGQQPRHGALLRSVANGLSQLFGRLAKSGHAGRTLAVTTSEFGRRVAENQSAGTDHGKAGLSFVIGPAATQRIIGEPELASLDDGDLPISIDTRSLYRDALGWLGGGSDVLEGDWAPTQAVAV